MNKHEVIKFLDPFIPEVELFILTGGHRVPIKTLMYELSDNRTGRILIEPEYIVKPDLVGESSESFLLWADGACSGNPGPGGWAYFLSAFSVIDGKYENGRANKSAGYHKGSTTNNAMELEAVIEGLYAAHSMAGERSDRHIITITSDSEYVVKGITGACVIKTNLPIWDNLRAVLADMSEWEIEWVRSSPSNTFHRWCDQAAKAAAKNKGDIGILAETVVQAPTH
jgi:ribonuclease HI